MSATDISLHGNWESAVCRYGLPKNLNFQHQPLFGQQKPTQETSSLCPLTIFFKQPLNSRGVGEAPTYGFQQEAGIRKGRNATRQRGWRDWHSEEGGVRRKSSCLVLWRNVAGTAQRTRYNTKGTCRASWEETHLHQSYRERRNRFTTFLVYPHHRSIGNYVAP